MLELLELLGELIRPCDQPRRVQLRPQHSGGGPHHVLVVGVKRVHHVEVLDVRLHLRELGVGRDGQVEELLREHELLAHRVLLLELRLELLEHVQAVVEVDVGEPGAHGLVVVAKLHGGGLELRHLLLGDLAEALLDLLQALVHAVGLHGQRVPLVADVAGLRGVLRGEVEAVELAGAVALLHVEVLHLEGGPRVADLRHHVEDALEIVQRVGVRVEGAVEVGHALLHRRHVGVVLLVHHAPNGLHPPQGLLPHRGREAVAADADEIALAVLGLRPDVVSHLIVLCELVLEVRA
mmetsp:Transcript_46019/g.147053  ORF Transcript_46019/g.147053 Transcript_46019/m.147053 type:complete len:294 (-) Transcript_46019:3015-3896(-)